MSEVRTYTVVASEPGDPEDSLRAVSPEGEAFLFTGIALVDVVNAVAGAEAALDISTSVDFENNRKEDTDGGK